MSRLLVTAARAVRRAAEQGQSVVAERASRRIVAVYDAIILRGLAFHEQQPALGRRPGARGKSARRPGHNLLVRLRDFKTEVLRFLCNSQAPPPPVSPIGNNGFLFSRPRLKLIACGAGT